MSGGGGDGTPVRLSGFSFYGNDANLPQLNVASSPISTPVLGGAKTSRNQLENHFKSWGIARPNLSVEREQAFGLENGVNGLQPGILRGGPGTNGMFGMSYPPPGSAQRRRTGFEPQPHQINATLRQTVPSSYVNQQLGGIQHGTDGQFQEPAVHLGGGAGHLFPGHTYTSVPTNSVVTPDQSLTQTPQNFTAIRQQQAGVMPSTGVKHLLGSVQPPPFATPNAGVQPGNSQQQIFTQSQGTQGLVLPASLSRTATGWNGVSNHIMQGRGLAPGGGNMAQTVGGVLARGGPNQQIPGLTVAGGQKLAPSLVNQILVQHAKQAGAKRRPSQPTTNSHRSKRRRGPGSPLASDSAMEMQNTKANAMLCGIKARPGPFLTTQTQLDSSAVKRLSMSLLSGVPRAVNMALNSLSVLLIRGNVVTPTEESKIVAALCRVIDRGLVGRDSSMVLPARKEPELEKKNWWEEEPGLFCEENRALDTLMWAICASNILRNMVLAAGDQSQIFTQSGYHLAGVSLKCLVRWEKELCPAYNELAGNVVDILQVIGGRVNLTGGKQGYAPLLKLLVKMMGTRDVPLRLRTGAAGALASVAYNSVHKGLVSGLLNDENGRQLETAIRDLLVCQESVASKSAEDESNGEMGYLELALPEPMKPFEKEILAWKLQGGAIVAATKVCESLCSIREINGGGMVAGSTSILRALISICTGKKLRALAAARMALMTSQHPLVISARVSLLRAERSSLNIISYLASERKYAQELRPFELDLVETAFSNCQQSKPISRILALMQKSDTS